MPWSEDEIIRLKAMWIASRSAGDISKALGTKTRNAVIGKVVRLKLNIAYPHSESANQFKPKKREKAARVPAPPRKPHPIDVLAALPPPPVDPDDKPRKTFAQLKAGDCRFIPGDPLDGGKIFCGDPQFPGFSYCERHARKAYELPKVKAPAEIKEKAEA